MYTKEAYAEEMWERKANGFATESFESWKARKEATRDYFNEVWKSTLDIEEERQQAAEAWGVQLNAYEMVKNAFEEIAAEDVAIYKAQLNEYHNWIDKNATDAQRQACSKALNYGWSLESASDEFIKLINGQSTMKIFSNGRIRRTKPTRGDV